jgi:Zn finger protein HypA/HybF involved in hydrogenase expression
MFVSSPAWHRSTRARCEECGITSWRGRPLSLALHHVNGDGDDNRLENLQLLCPNCHSQTENFGARNRRAA